MSETRPDFADLLEQSARGNQAALDQLLPLVYQELHGLAHRVMRSRVQSGSLQTTSLLHETYVRLAGKQVSWGNRGHFLAIAARTMRRVLIDEARSRYRVKRGGGSEPVPLDEEILGQADDASLLHLNDSLEALERLDPQQARMVEMHYFGGMSYDEIAAELNVSPSTISRGLRAARAFLAQDVGDAR